MEYHGPLYGVIDSYNYFYTGKTTQDWDALLSERDELKAWKEEASQQLIEHHAHVVRLAEEKGRAMHENAELKKEVERLKEGVNFIIQAKGLVITDAIVDSLTNLITVKEVKP